MLKRDAWLLTLVYCEFWISAAFGLLQPFFPVLASSKGLDAWKYGFVFSACKLSMFIGSLLGDKFMMATSPLTCYLVGLGGFSLFTVVFGCLFWAPDGNVLLGLAITLVTLGGLTNTLYLVSMFAVVTTRFRKCPGYIIAFLEFLWGSGTMVGAAIGGALIDVWDFPLPFFVLGVITFLMFPIIIRIGRNLNNAGECASVDAAKREPDMKYARLLWDPEYLAALITLTLSWIMFGFNEPTLEPSLREFNLSSTETGIVYTVQFASYAAGGVVAGASCSFHGRRQEFRSGETVGRRTKHQGPRLQAHFQTRPLRRLEAFYSLVGLALSSFGYLLVGPAPFLHSTRHLWMVYLSQVFMGLGASAQFICGYCRALKLVLLRGYPDNIRSSGFVSSSVFTFAVFGSIVAPPAAGYLVETFGYPTGSMAMLGLLLAWFPVSFCIWIKSLFPGHKYRTVDTHNGNK
uniref:Putative mfs-type transporter n=1 Tax=Ixodes scapularis TaxID=6945 RepID=A0A4D5RRY2_IXOSC